MARPHGLGGELVVAFSSNRPERMEPGATLFSDHGELRVEAARPFGRRFLVTFAGVDTLEAAERLRGAVLRARPLVDGDALWVHELVGSVVVRVGDGTQVGTVTSVIANPASDMLRARQPARSCRCGSWCAGPSAASRSTSPPACWTERGARGCDMRIAVFTIFPDLLEHFCAGSLLGRAGREGLLEVQIHDLRAGAGDPRRSVDDAPFGGGAGMVLAPGPIFEAVEAVGPPRPLYLLGPGGRRLDQGVVEELAACAATPSGGFSLLCGRYEGVDQRVADHLVDGELSIGDYVLAGGEAAALVVVEAVARLVPGVMGNEASAGDESFSTGLLEYPQYTRPATFRGWPVPEVLVSGDHGRVATLAAGDGPAPHPGPAPRPARRPGWMERGGAPAGRGVPRGGPRPRGPLGAGGRRQAPPGRPGGAVAARATRRLSWRVPAGTVRLGRPVGGRPTADATRPLRAGPKGRAP